MLKLSGALAASCAALGALSAAAAPTGTSSTLTVGPGPVSRVVAGDGRTLSLSIRPNRAATWNTISLALGLHGTALHEARVTLSFTMPSMAMGTQTFVLREGAPGVYTYVGPALVMPGRWNLALRAASLKGALFTALIDDRVS